ncbi:MAG: right-handed parallel beta-helix repeat-containing protein [Actinomycetia bacterium]|nr:right-handed parallel beta-helix repeat-containing protein [Actinomycetota bacterium]MCG2795655.1 right-handed parallel beta-helix repeat-containing protein [Actinomycetes bacterium]
MIRASIRASLIAVLLALLVAAPCGIVSCDVLSNGAGVVGSGNIYYVSLSGSDSNPGTVEAPWATPGYGSRQLEPGDTLVILGGTYPLSVYDDDMIIPPAGSAGAWITIRGEEGNRPVLAGSDNLFSAVDISDSGYVRLENLEITSDNGAPFRGGIVGSRPVCNVVLENLYIHHIDEEAVSFGDVDNLRVTGCVMSYCGFGCLGGPEGQQDGWTNVVISGSTLSYSGHYYQGGPGPGPYDRPDGFGIESSPGPIEIRNTLCEHNRGDGLDSKAADTYIHDCIVANNFGDGVKLWQGDSKVENTLIYGTGDGIGGGSPWAGIVAGSEKPGARFEIINVTVGDNPAREAYPVYFQYDSTSPVTMVMRNTIIANGYGLVYFGDSVDLTCDHNLFYRTGDQWQVHANGRDYTADEFELGALGAGNLSRDTMFVSPAWGTTGDYRLEAGSPAIDSGSGNGAPHTDLDGYVRPYGGGFDMGAYEYGSHKPVAEYRAWGHDSIGVTGPAKTWYLAEGCTAGGFETWVLVQNPGDEDATVNLTYMTESGAFQGPRLELAAHSRQTVNVADTVPTSWGVSTTVTSDGPVIVERAMYGIR